MKKCTMLLGTLLLVALTPCLAGAAVIKVPDDYGTIQEGINAAVNGDSVMVADGTYSGLGNRDINFLMKSIFVESENGATGCVIDCQGSESEPHRGFIIDEYGTFDSTVLSGFTIVNGYSSGYSSKGGAILLENASATIQDCIFISNTSEHNGGAIAMESSYHSVIWNCTFTGNIAEYNQGGAIYSKESGCEVTTCHFQENAVTGSGGVGGAVAIREQSYIEIVDCSFTSNTCPGEYSSGGAVDIAWNSQSEIVRCIFENNFARLHGGAVQVADENRILSCTFLANNAEERGGGLYFTAASGEITRCAFENNTALYGGGICLSESSPTVGGSEQSANTFSGNSAATGMDIAAMFSPTTQINAQYNNFQGYYGSDYYVSPNGAFDLTNSTYIIEPVLQDVYVTVTGDDTNDGLTWETAFRTIQHAASVIFTDSETPRTIYLGEGTFSPSSTGEIFPIPAIYNVSIRGSGAVGSILDAEGTGGCFFIYRDRDVFVDNILFTGGIAHRGGGLYCHESNPVIRNCLFQNNSAANYKARGGGIFMHDSRPLIEYCTISSNQAREGGGIFSFGSNLAMEHCSITNNSAEWSGGGISSNYNEDPSYCMNCILTSNSASSGGGAKCVSTNQLFFNCLFTQNTAEYGGAVACYCTGTSTEFASCTMTGNIATVSGGAFSASKFSYHMVRNSILYNNMPQEIGGIPPSEVSYSLVSGGWTGTGNIDGDPLFTIGPDGNFYLSQTAAGQVDTSPCVDTAGDTAEAICINTSLGNICLRDLTTRTDLFLDTENADMGYHYGSTGMTCRNDGDVDRNGVLTPEDSLLSFRIYLGSWPNPSWAAECSADCNGSGAVSPADALCIFQHYVSASCECSDPI